MGNSLRVGLNDYSGTVGYPSRLQLGGSATMDLSTQVLPKSDDGGFWEGRRVTYTIDGSTCDFMLARYVEKDGKVNTICFSLHNWLHLRVDRAVNNNFLKTAFKQLSPKTQPIKTVTNRTIDPWGGVVDTKVYFCGDVSKGWSLVVSKCKKNSGNQEYYSEITLAHYYTFIGRTEIGLSMVAHIYVSNDKLDITMEGPVQHPASALVNLFHEVESTGKWRASMCCHCANIQRLRQFDSDDSDSEGLPLLQRHFGWQQNARSIANAGRFWGNGNGSIINCRNFYA